MPDVDFLGKGDVYAHHLTVPFQVLVADAGKSCLPKGGKPDLGGNLIIQGDNLKALKSLLPRYEGKVNCIYIDPPYNTGNEGWAYNDNVNSPMITKWLGKTVDGDDQCRHDKWLCMMWPRLQLLKDLLAEDGVIFISIDDNEQHRLRMMMDEIFGEENFVANIVWQKKYAPANDAKYFSDNHDFVLCYAKTLAGDTGNTTATWQRRLLPRTDKQDKLYKYDDNDGRGLWRTDNLTVKSYSPDYDYAITNSKTNNKYKPSQGTCWRTSKENIKKWIKENRVFFGHDGKGAPQLKRYLNEVQQGIVPLTIWTYDEVGHTDGARKLLKGIFSDQQLPFDNPKALGLLQRICTIAADKNAIILDSFAGSGTTAHAVLALNKEDGGNRKFILVECEDEIAEKTTAERVRRVIKGVKGAKDESLRKGLGGSFTYCTLGEELNEDKMLTGESLPDYETLAAHIFWTATGETLRAFKPREDWFIGESARFRVYLVYKPDPAFLKSNASALTGELAEKIAKRLPVGKKILVYAPSVFVGRKELVQQGIVFCQLPWTIHQRMG